MKTKQWFKWSISMVFAFAVVLLSVFLLSPKAEAYSYTSGYYTYEVLSDGTAMITDCNTSISGSVWIPTKLSYYTVSAIGDNAFEYCTGITQLVIEGSITEIGDNAFGNCTGLNGVSIYADIETMGNRAFAYCSNLLSISFEGKVGSVGDSAFYNCSRLQQVSFPEGLKTVGSYAFYGCSNLYLAYLPNSVTKVGGNAFGSCNNLNYMTYNNAYYLGDYGSNYNVLMKATATSISSVSVHSTTKCIADRAFQSCTALTSVSIPYGVTSIGYASFSSCSALTSITLPATVVSIDEYAFAYNTKLSSISIPNSITDVKANAFSSCSALSYTTYSGAKYLGNTSNKYALLVAAESTSITGCAVHSQTRCIAEKAFNGCSALVSLSMSGNVKAIGDAAFMGCSSLTSVSVPDSVEKIGVNAFKGCGGLTSIAVPFVGLTRNSGETFPVLFGTESYTNAYAVTQLGITYYVPSGLTTVSITGGDIPSNGMINCTSLTELHLGTGVNNIGYRGLAYCSKLADVTLASSQLTFGQYVFEKCTMLTDVTIPEGVTTLTEYLFYNCSKLSQVVLPDSLTQIEAYAFYGCYNLSSLSVPDSVASISASAFYDCRSLSAIWTGENNTVYSSDASGVLYNKDKTVLIKVPCGMDGEFVIPDGVTLIDEYAFDSCSKITAVTVPVSVVQVKSNAFGYSGSLTDVYYGGTIEQWNAISISWGNNLLNNATLHCHEHSFTDYVSNGDATCTADGTKTAKCDSCDAVDTVIDTGSNGHTWDEGTYTAPTKEADAFTTYVCKVCSEENIEIHENTRLYDPAITAQPQSVTVDSGESACFEVTAVGEVISYNWQYRKIYKWFDTTMEGHDTDTLTVPATGARNGYDYRCVVTYADGTVLISDPAELTVTTYLEITSHPNDQTVVLGYKGQFTAAATGEGVKYQWQYQRPGSELWIDTAMEGCTKPTVMIETTTARDGYKYRCEITDVTGNVLYTNTATMRVLSFAAHPEMQFSSVNGSVQFTVTTSVEDGFTYQWQYRRSEIGGWSDTTMTGYDTAMLTVEATLARNGYQYRCVLTGSKNSTIASREATLCVGDPVVITAQPDAYTGVVGENAVFTVEAVSAYAFQWQYRRGESGSWLTTSMEGASTDTLTVEITSGRNGYQYRCRITGLDGLEYYTDPATLTVE